MLALSLLYAFGRGVPLIEGALFGIKAAVLVIVIEALVRIGKRALKTSLLLSLAGAAFIGIFFLELPFPLIVAVAALEPIWCRAAPEHLGVAAAMENVPLPAKGPLAALRHRARRRRGWCGGRRSRSRADSRAAARAGQRRTVSPSSRWSASAAPMRCWPIWRSRRSRRYGWMTAPEMVDGLGLAETTPGPLILVTQFVGFLAAVPRRRTVFTIDWPACSARRLTTWVTFVPSMLWIFACRTIRRATARQQGGCPAR